MDYSALKPYLLNIVKATEYTVLIAILAAFFGLVIGLILALMKQTKISPLRWFANIYTDIFRGTPVLLQIFFIWFVVFRDFPFISPFIAAVVTLSFNSGAYVSEIMRAGIEGVDKGQIEAARSLGVRNKDVIIDIIIPQAFRRTLPPLINEFAALIKESSIAYFIGVEEIMYNVHVAMSNTYQLFAPLVAGGICYYVVVKLVSVFGKYVERKLSYDRH